MKEARKIRSDRERRYWLFKSEPEEFSIQDLARAPSKKTSWDGVRNYQARNFLRDDIKVGDGVLFYHSSAAPPAIAGIARVVKEGHPDPTAFDPKSPHYDPKSLPEDPRWFMVSIELDRIFERSLPLADLKKTKGLEKMVLLQRGSRLSVQPVTAAEWKRVIALAETQPLNGRS